MKSISTFALKALAVLLVLTFIVAMIPFTPKALSYSGSSSYMSGTYYRNLTAVTLTGNQRTDIVNIAKSQVGYHEGSSSSQLSGHYSGSGNYTEYGRWYGLQDMWCAMFVSWCARVAGVSTSVVPSHSFTVTGLQYFMNRSRAYSRATIAAGGYTPQAGDIIYFKSSRNNNITNHVGIVTGYSGSTVYTIEGNTTGNCVATKSYSISNTTIVYICKPNYSGSSSSGSSSGSSSSTTVNTGTYVSCFDAPVSTGAGSGNQIITTSTYTVDRSVDSKVYIGGWSVHSQGISRYQYNLDGGDWANIESYYREDVASGTGYTNCTKNAFRVTLDTSGWSAGQHKIGIRGFNGDESVIFTIGWVIINVVDGSGSSSGGSTSTDAGTYVSSIDAPVSTGAGGANQVITTSTYTKYKGSDNLMYIGGWSVHSQGISRYQYNLDGGDWANIDTYFRQDVADGTGYTNCTKNAFRTTLDVTNWSEGEHTIGIRGFNENESVIFSIAWIKIKVVADNTSGGTTTPSTPTGSYLTDSNVYGVYVSSLENPSYTGAGSGNLVITTSYTKYKGVDNLMYIQGWSVHQQGISRYQYDLDDGDWYDIDTYYREDVANATAYTNCTKNAFRTTLDVSNWSIGQHKVGIRGFNENESIIYPIGWIIVNVVEEYRTDLDVPNIAGVAAQKATVSTQTVNNSLNSLALEGWHINRNGISGYSYYIQGTSVSGSLATKYRSDVALAHSDYTACNDINAFVDAIPFGSLASGSYTVVLKATTKSGSTYEFATIPVNYTKNVIDVPDISIEIDNSTGLAIEEDQYGKTLDFTAGMDCDDILAILATDGCTILDAKGNVVTSGILKTGYSIVYMYEGVEADKIVVIVHGDLDGDGVVNAKDILKAKKFADSTFDASNAYYKAADLSNTSSITDEDLSAIGEMVVG